MITVKFVGGAKKLFLVDTLDLNKSDIILKDLLDMLVKTKPTDTPDLDISNILVAINGADCSALDGNLTKITDGDVVSIIPVIHGGALLSKIYFEISKKNVLVIEIKGQKVIDVTFLDDLRKRFPRIKLQAISSKFIFNKYHLEKILQLSINSYKNKILLSSKLEIDILMRFALTNQISNAIANAGLKPNENFMLVAIGNKHDLDSLFLEVKNLSTNLFSKNHQSFIKKYAKITKKHTDSTCSEHSFEDVLIEKATVLF